ncbi:MAG: hypothetical protein AAF560_27350 [Acidobacteriota bacterium]
MADSTTTPGAKPDPTSERRTAWSQPRVPYLVALGTLVIHGLLALGFPLPGAFRKYGLAAEQFLSGELPLERLMDFSPLYFHLCVVMERWLTSPELVLSAVQIGLTAASVGLMFELLRRRFSPRLAALAAAVMAFDRHLLIYSRILEPEAILLFCLLAMLAVLYRRPWLAGIFAGLCLATRPTFLPAFLLVPLAFWVAGDRSRRLVRRSALFLLPVALTLALLAWRAGTVTGDSGSPVMNPGTVFFEGNNPLSHGTSAIYPPVVLAHLRHSADIPDSAHAHYRTVARAATGRNLSISEVNAYWSSRALRFIRDQPQRFIGLLGNKLVRAFHSFRWHDVMLAWQLDGRLSLIPTLPFALLSALALIGALFEVRNWRPSLLYYALGLSQLAVMLAFYVSARQRMVLLPAVLYFAAVAIERLRRHGRAAWPWMALVALLTLSLSLPDDPISDERYRRGAALETEILLEQTRTKSRQQPLALHSELAVEAVAAAPWWLDWLRPAYFPQDQGTLDERVADLLTSRPSRGAAADFDLAAVRIAAGRTAAARELLEPLAEGGWSFYRGGQQPSQPRHLLAIVDALEGDRERAIAGLEATLESAPGDPFVLADLVALGGDDAYQQQLSRYWSELDGQYLLGRSLLRFGRFKEAAQALGYVAQRMPDFRDAKVLLAAALGRSGRFEEGAKQYLEATEIRLEPILASRDIVHLFRNWTRSHPEDIQVQLATAQVLHQHGRFEEALVILQGLQPPEHLLDPVGREIRRIQRAMGA